MVEKSTGSIATAAVDGWLPEYLEKMYGVTVTEESYAGNLYRNAFSQVDTDDLVELLLARFDELDLIPKDGIVSILEIERSLANPLLHWTDKDVQMIRLLRRYFNLLIELSDDETGVRDRGISRKDVEALNCSINEACGKIRARMQSEFGDSKN